MVVLTAAAAVVATRHRLTGILLAGAVGYGVAGVFVVRGAPGLALTQFLVETMTLVVVVLVLRRMPARGTILYVVHHIVVQAALFLVAGLAVRRAGTTALHRMAQRPPSGTLVVVLCAVPALSLSGIPPFSGFVAKLALVEAGVEQGGPTACALAAAALLTSLLALYAMSRVGTSAFMGRPPEPGKARLPERRQLPPG
ncbi:hydrogenase subunit MbhD domain-containing protein [Streptomyces bobili]|uniref:hydrogenase subunit MbhD domain-containing protein n=1 Tax=Streptomyces bobili TaxID=67280 RepID=UPI0033BE54B0